MRLESEHLMMDNETYIGTIAESEQSEKDNNHSSFANNNEAVR